jgi:hypothetical protein
MEPLTTSTLNRYCKRAVKKTPCNYMGTFAAWKIPSAKEWVRASRDSDAAFVANTDLAEEPGTHWVLFYMPQDPSKKPFFFDSFGRDPPEMGRPGWDAYLKAACHYRGGDGKWDDNEPPVQHPKSSVCGHLCVMALWKLARGEHVPRTIVSMHRIKKFMNKYITK